MGTLGHWPPTAKHLAGHLHTRALRCSMPMDTQLRFCVGESGVSQCSVSTESLCTVVLSNVIFMQGDSGGPVIAQVGGRWQVSIGPES